VACLFLLSVFLCWGGAVVHAPDPVPQGESFAASNTDAFTGKPTVLILLGAGLVPLAIWGLKKCRKLPSKSDIPG
jgi:hypothetical protein